MPLPQLSGMSFALTGAGRPASHRVLTASLPAVPGPVA
jgi:hypothetical protein